MGTIAEKLNYTLEAKDNIKASILDKGVDMPDATPLGEYGTYIREIVTGGSGEGGSGDTGGGGVTTPTDLCDDTPVHVWVGGDNLIYVNDADWPNVRAFVVPITPGSTYSVKSVTVGDRERIALSTQNPLDITYDYSYMCTRMLNNSSSPVAGYETLFTAASNENSLVIFYSTSAQEGVEYEVYELVPNGTGGGSGGGGAVLNLIPGVMYAGRSEFSMHSDTELASDISVSNFVVSDNVSTIEKVDVLDMIVTLGAAATKGEQISIKAISSAYLNKNGNSEELIINVEDLKLLQLIDTLIDMEVVRNNSYNDGATDTMTFTNTWRNANSSEEVNTVGATGDSVIIVNNSQKILLNNRDSSSYYVWKQEGIADGLPFIKVRWKGASAYGGAIDQEYEVVLVGNGDLFIHLISVGTYTDGITTLFGLPFNFSMDTPDIAFYRDNYYGSSFTIAYEKYDLSKHNTLADVYEHIGNLADFVDNYSTMPVCILNNVKNDDGTVNTSFIDFVWSYNNSDVTTVYYNGNSWIGLGGTSENVRLNRRDAAIYYAYMRNAVLTDYNNLKAVQIVWGGSSAYSSTIDQWWELWLFENGDAMIHCKQLGNYTGGTSAFYDVTYTPSTGSYHSFYRQDAAGTSWTLEDAIYDASKHVDF